MCIRKIISKIIHTEKLKLEIIDKIFDIGNCIRFDLINATLQFQSLFAPLWCCFKPLKCFLNPFHAILSLSDLILRCFSAKSEFCKKWDKNYHKAEKSEFFKLSAIRIIGNLKKSSTFISLSKLSEKLSQHYRY